MLQATAEGRQELVGSWDDAAFRTVDVSADLRLRSDAGLLKFGLLSDIILFRDAANVLGLRPPTVNASDTSRLLIYDQFDVANYARLLVGGLGNGTFYMLSQTAGTGTVHPFFIGTGINTDAHIGFLTNNLERARFLSGTDLGHFALVAGIDVRISSDGFLGWRPSSVLNALPDTILGRDAAGVLALRNGIVAQELRVYGTTIGPKYFSLKHDGTNGIVDVAAASGRLNLGGNANAVAVNSNLVTSRNVLAYIGL